MELFKTFLYLSIIGKFLALDMWMKHMTEVALKLIVMACYPSLFDEQSSL